MEVQPRTYRLEQFEGPLDLLLNMIREEKLAISEISLATVAEQFVAYVQSTPDIGGDELADFLVVATQLLLIKSKLLLPDINLDDEFGPDTLETQLKLYRRFVDAAKQLEQKIAQHLFLYPRTKLPLEVQKQFRPPLSLTPQGFEASMREVLSRLEPIVILPQSVMEKTITMHEKIRYIQALLKRSNGLSFRAVLKEAQTKTEQIVSFLALLELVKQQEVAVEQAGAFDDILIKRMN